MKRAVRDAWADALESGRYKQGYTRLHYSEKIKVAGVPVRTEDRWCCLGVLCDLAVKAGVIPEPQQVSDGPGGFTFRYGHEGETNSSVLPGSVVKWAGFSLHSVNPVLNKLENGYEQVASELNDLHGVLFPKIAELVRALPVDDEVAEVAEVAEVITDAS